MNGSQEYWVPFQKQVTAPQDLVTDKKEKDGVSAFLLDVLDSAKTAIIIVLLVFTFLFRVVGVEGSSMLPTFQNGNWLAVTAMQLSPVERGDVVIVTQPWDRNVPIIKRVIGIGGDVIDIDFVSGTVIRNGEALEENYTNSPTNLMYDIQFPVTVPEGKLFVMGDNRNDSLDSRSSQIGFVDENYVLGKAVFRLFPVFR